MISVIVVIYNEEDYIPRCIESILRQTYTKLEILLVDDGSTDRSGSICDAYAAQDSRCRVIHQSNSGIAGARNAGLRHITGRFVMFVDGDDYIDPRFCERLRQALVETGSTLAVGDARRVPDSIGEVETSEPECCNRMILSQDEWMKRLFTQTEQHHTDVMVWGKLYARELLDGVFFKDVIGEDIEYNSRVLQKVSKGVFVDTVLYYWVQRPSSISRQPFGRRHIDGLKVWVSCLNNLPAAATVYRGYALLRLYKDILSNRYRASAVLKPYVRETTDRLVRQTGAEFKRNPSIPDGLKCGIWLMYRMPWIYALFIRLAGKWARITSRCRLTRTENDQRNRSGL